MSACLHMRSQSSFPALSSTPHLEVSFNFRNTELGMSIGQVSPYRDRRCNICCIPKPFTLLRQEVKQKAKINIYIYIN